MKQYYFIISLLILLVFSFDLLAQSGVIRGKVREANTNEPVPFANVLVKDTEKGGSTDLEGNFEISGLDPGVYSIEVRSVGYRTEAVLDIQVTRARPATVNVELREDTQNLEGVEISATAFTKTSETPLSVRSLGANQIRRSPGGNRDVSQVIRSLPGVASTVSFRNDIIIRGGAPNENKFFLDGIEIPVINHFQTQGASGGPVGMINVDLIKRVDFYSGAFPVNRDNTLSSIFEFVQIDGRDDKWALNAVVGASDLGIFVEGPVSDNSTFVFSARRSYLQFLFSIIGLPFLPIYNDYQTKYTWNINEKTKLSVLSIGALDQFSLNEEAGGTPEQDFLLNNLPIFEQWNYTIGAKLERFRKNGFSTLVLSRSMLNNRSFKFQNNDDSDPDNLILDYLSQEIENKLRWEDYRNKWGLEMNYGLNYEFARYNNRTFNRIVAPSGVEVIDFFSELDMNKFGFFAQASRPFFNDKLNLSLGIRTDFNDYSRDMANPLEQLSPRLSASYQFTREFSWNFNTGIYYQLPPYTILGYRDTDTGELENKNNGIRYIQSNQLVSGFEYLFGVGTRLTVEGFYKRYFDYPFLLRDQISLANLGGDFGVIGNEPASPDSEGRAYGLEFLAEQQLTRGFYGLAAYTLVRSEFTDGTGTFLPSAWDNRHIVSLTGGKAFKRNWELAVRWLFSGGAPFTPFDLDRSLRIENWNIRGQGIPDFNRLNSLRAGNFQQLDLRVDKKYFFDKWSLNLFLDVQNITNFQTELQPNLSVQKDAAGNPIVNPDNPSQFLPNFLNNPQGTILPTIGIIVEI
ncbi:MAG: TonB-dependent receptor [Cyclobacteriaceae bacterium]|nr:TonB-dependent receptor [Cyclobacteriaceae bacterium]MCH8515048.1 TonB-dependent receptor [Cyclobacteriaceae bacterium]